MTSLLKNWGIPLLTALVLVILFRTFFFDIYKTTPNNKPTDFFWVNKTRKIARYSYVVFNLNSQTLIGKVAAVAGDSVRIFRKNLIVNNQLRKDTNLLFDFYVMTKHKSLQTAHRVERLTLQQALKLKKQAVFLKMKAYPRQQYFNFQLLQNNALLQWNPDFFGAIRVPYRGFKIKISKKTIAQYYHTIKQEMATAEIIDNQLFVQKQQQTYYTFLNDYFFVLNDARDCTNDSRSFGFISTNNYKGTILNPKNLENNNNPNESVCLLTN